MIAQVPPRIKQANTSWRQFTLHPPAN